MDKPKDKKPLISIFAICHKHELYVLDTLNSIKNQTYPNIQIIIINNIKDNCEFLIKEWINKNKFRYPPVFIQNQAPLKLTQNMNLGLSHCEGKYFQGISCDDILVSDKIEKQVALFTQLDTNYACIYSDMIFIDEKSNKMNIKSFYGQINDKWPFFFKNNFEQASLLCATNPFPAPTVLLKTQIVKDLGGYNETIELEDYSLNLELYSKGYKFYVIDTPLVYYRILEGSLSMVFRNEKFHHVYYLLKKYAACLNVKNKDYRGKFLKGVLLQPSFIAFIKEYKEYIRYTGDSSLIRFLKTMLHFIKGTVRKQKITRL